jgi:hypothetical protein
MTTDPPEHIIAITITSSYFIIVEDTSLRTVYPDNNRTGNRIKRYEHKNKNELIGWKPARSSDTCYTSKTAPLTVLGFYNGGRREK